MGSLILIFVRPWANSSSETKTNDTSKYTVNKHTALSSVIYEYCLKDDAQCTQVNYEDAVFWKYSDNTSYGYPKRFSVNVSEKKGSVTFKDYVCYYRLEGLHWHLYFTAKKDYSIDSDNNKKDTGRNYFLKKESDYIGHSFNSVRGGGPDSGIVYKDATVDITVEHNTDQYGYEELEPGHGQDDCKLYVMKHGYRCNKVNDGSMYNIWTAKGDERVTEILLSDKRSPRKIVELVFTDCSRKYFYKPFVLLPWQQFTPK
nr:hypothetical protein MACL_00001899 [Theileria orientalis]